MTCGRAITHGISHAVGQVAVGTLADLVIWKPENFGAKPEMVLKSGVIVYAQVCPKIHFPRLHHQLKLVDGRRKRINPNRPTNLPPKDVGRPFLIRLTQLHRLRLPTLHHVLHHRLIQSLEEDLGCEEYEECGEEGYEVE